jgi:type II secretory pathway pseudopilin PulG
MRWFLIVVCGVALVIAVLVTQMVMQAKVRSNQLKTSATMRDVANEVEAYARDHNHYPTAASVNIKVHRDGWGNPLRYECWQTDPSASGCDHYAITSAGSDGKFETASARDVTKGAFDESEGDIVLSNGEFIRFPTPPRGMRN